MARQTKTPAVSCRGSLRSSVRRPPSEVALNADVQIDRVLVLELVSRDRLRSRRRDARDGTGNTRELLVEVEPADFSRERQVLDRGPAGDKAQLIDVVVRVAAVIRRLSGETTAS